MKAVCALLLLAAVGLVAVNGQDCGKEHPKVGLSAELDTFQHDVSGTVVIVDDCSFKVENFKYDGTGPDVFWYAADTKENLDSGFIMDSIPKEHGPWDGSEEVMITLPEGVTWDDVNAISVWCRAFGIDFGSTVFPPVEEKEEEEEAEEEEEEEEEAEDECGMEHEKFNTTGELETFQHEVTGTVVIIDDCSFEVKNFTYDGTGPDVFWYAADTRENLDTGFIMDAIPEEHGPWDGSEEVIVKLPEGVTWDDVNVISVWCRAFGIDFGSVAFGESEDDKEAAREAAMDLDYEGKDNKTMDSNTTMEGAPKNTTMDEETQP